MCKSCNLGAICKKVIKSHFNWFLCADLLCPFRSFALRHIFNFSCRSDNKNRRWLQNNRNCVAINSIWTRRPFCFDNLKYDLRKRSVLRFIWLIISESVCFEAWFAKQVQYHPVLTDYFCTLKFLVLNLENIFFFEN